MGQLWKGGVYDIANHFLYESNRGIGWISPLLPASCGGSGDPNADAMDSVSATQRVLELAIHSKNMLPEDLVLEGDAAGSAICRILRGKPHPSGRDTDNHSAPAPEVVQFPLVVVQAAVADLTVSTTSQSIPFFDALVQRGMTGGRLLLYEGQMAHADFIIDWLLGEDPVAREARRSLLDVGGLDASKRAALAKHVYGEIAAALPDVSTETRNLGPSAHIRDLVRVLLNMDWR